MAACALAAAAETGGPVARWDFDGALQDRVAGGARDGLTARDEAGKPAAPRFVTAGEVPGTVGKAVALGVRPGDAGYLTAPLSAVLKLGPSYTIEAWAHPTQLSGWNRLVLNWGPAPQYAYHLALHNGLASLYHGQADGKYVFAEGGQVRAGLWHHVAGVAERNEKDPAKSTLAVYLDGRRVAMAPFDGTIRTLDREGLGIGDSAGAPTAACRFRGYLGEVVLWNRALGAEEIAAHYATRAPLLRELELAQRKQELAARAEAFGKLLALGVEEIVFAERGPGRDPAGHYYANFGYSCTDPSYWLHGVGGGRLWKLNARTCELTALLDDPQGGVRDPQVHYDGKRILLSYRKGDTHHYNLYEINADGSGLRPITSGPWDDVEPTYLPDGGILFSSTRCKRYIGCWLAPSATLHRCDADGRDIRMLSSGAFTENTPAVLPDGRVLYTRWEYVNRDPVSFHHLWTMSPDGTAQSVYYGNFHPGGVFIDARPIPGTDRVVLIHSPGHGINEHAGSVALATARYGPESPAGMRSITRTAEFRDPWPLSQDAFLVARGSQILLMNARGEAEVVHEAPGTMLHEPRPLVPRPRETVIAPQIDQPAATATVFLADLYRGRNLIGVRRGAIRWLLVLEDLPKPANYHGGGSQPIGHGVTSTLKRILGIVPVEADGSAYFEAPAMRSLYFALLDENGLSVEQMRSFVTFQPGEAAGCVGCHEPRAQTTRSGQPLALALLRPPSRIEPIRDVPEILDFPRDIQPILDRHCVRCHNAADHKGGVVLEGDRGPVFSLTYYTLYLHWQIKDTHGNPGHGSGRQPGNDPPYATYSSASPLMKKIDGSHNDVRLSPVEHKTIRLWIDTSAQYAGTYAAYGTGQVGGCWGNNEPIRVMADAWPSTPHARDAIQRRCAACHPAGQLPQHVTALTATDHGDMLSWTRPLSRYSRHHVFNLTRPEKSLILLAPLSRKAGGYAEGDPPKDGAARSLPDEQGVPRSAGSTVNTAGQASRGKVEEDRSRPPRPAVHPILFTDAADPDYQKILVHLQAAKAKLDEIKRFDMPGFRPRKEYVREMQRFGILPPDFPADAPLDAYATDQAYWRSFWPQPAKP